MGERLSSDLASLKIDRKRPSGPPRALYYLLGAGALGAAAWALQGQAVRFLENKVLKVEVQTTEIRTVSPVEATVELTSTGYVEPQRVSKVGAKLPGRVTAIHVREGQTVKRGDLLMELESADRRAAVEAARSRVAATRARVMTAQATLAETRLQAERERKLAARGVSPAAKAEDLEARAKALAQQVKAAQAEVRAAQAEVKALRVNLSYLKITAPIDGTVVNKPPEIGELVGRGGDSAGSDEIELADFGSILVETDVPEARLHMVKLGSPCEIALDAFPKRRFRGEAVELSPRVDRAKATVGVKVKFVDATDGVLPDMAARVSFLQEPLEKDAMQEPPKTVVPASAIVERGGGKVVFVLDEERVKMVNVTLGEPFANGFVLLSGPSPGTRLVSDPPADLKDGQRVKEKT